MRAIVTFFFAIATALCLAQFKVDEQHIPIVQSRRRALIIGASQYEHLGTLHYSTSDAKRFRDALERGFRFTDDSIRFLSDDGDAEKPTSKNILSALQDLLADPVLDKGDLFILYFSGHGIGTPKGDYLCATDSTPQDVEKTGLPVREVIQKLVDAQLRNVVIVADACRAGDKNDFGSELYGLAKKANLAVLLGCEPGQKSYESSRIHSGVFTYFLLRAMADPANRTASGGLWTSRISDSIANGVYEFTRPDYGDNAQRPMGFADPTSDVLLAKFLDAKQSTQLSKGDVDLKQVSNPKKIADEIRATVEPLFDGHDYEAILDLCKQALSLDPTNMYCAYYATVATPYLGRSGEQEKYCDMLKRSKDPYFYNLGFVQSDSRMTAVDDRTKSLRAYWESSPKDEVTALIVWGKAREFAPLTSLRELLQMMMPDLKDGRLKSFFAGEIAFTKNELAKSLELYRAALKQPETVPSLSDDVLTVIQFPILRLLNRNDELKTMIEALLKKDDVSPIIAVTGAANLRAIGERKEAVETIKKLLNRSHLSEMEVILSAQIIGANLIEVADELELQVLDQPYSWRIRTAAAIAVGMRDKDANATAKAFEAAERYCDDELEVISLTYKIENAVLEDGTQNFGIDPSSLMETYDLFRMLYFNQADRIGTDWEKWAELGQLGAETLQGPATMRLMRKYIKDFASAPDMGTDFYLTLFQLATSVEDDDLVKFATSRQVFVEPDSSDMRVMYAAYLISRGKDAEAFTVAATVKGGSETNAIVKRAIEVVRKGRSGDVGAMKQFLSEKFENNEAGIAARGIVALTMCDLGHGEEALDVLATLANIHGSMVSSVSLRCEQQYLKLLKKQGKTAEADDLLYELLKVNQTSPAVTEMFFGTKADIGNYVGTTEAETSWISDEEFDSQNPTHTKNYLTCAVGDGHIKVTVATDGAVTGYIDVKNGERFEIAGRVDANGNLRGEAKSATHRFDLTAKMVSNAYRKSETFKKSHVGQSFQFFNEKGLVTQWMLPADVLNPGGGG
ncbi:MAG: caspase family protein [Armatimonadetes bacterium]|nr:caspase family protein [Armatimonadota bacterium]